MTNPLRAHIRAMHPWINPRRSLVLLERDHAHEHHRYLPNHYHAGTNLGPDQRPPGWRTGEDAIATQRRQETMNDIDVTFTVRVRATSLVSATNWANYMAQDITDRDFGTLKVLDVKAEIAAGNA